MQLINIEIIKNGRIQMKHLISSAVVTQALIKTTSSPPSDFYAPACFCIAARRQNDLSAFAPLIIINELSMSDLETLCHETHQP